MELKDTVQLMQSDDYKDRFIAEYRQLVIRFKKLRKMVENWNNLDFLPECPKAAYKAAYTKHGLSHVMPGGSSCDVFVATVARESGVDPDFACCGVQSSSIPHLEKSDKWEEITYSDPKDTSFFCSLQNRNSPTLF